METPFLLSVTHVDGRERAGIVCGQFLAYYHHPTLSGPPFYPVMTGFWQGNIIKRSKV
jgi:hypothetical protein